MSAELDDWVELDARLRRESFSVQNLCFGPQTRFALATSRRRVARCSRRAGKTTGVAHALLQDALRKPFAPQLYVTLTRSNAKEIIWGDLLRLNEHYDLGGKPNLVDLTLTWDTGAAIHLRGANNEREIAKIRGKRFKRAVIDEAQAFPDRILRPLVDDTIGPALLDFDGELWVVGTPGPIPVGYFHDIDVGKHSEGWDHHSWTMRENIWLPRLSGRKIDDLIEEVLKDHGWTSSSPTFRREYLGEWTLDKDALVFHWSDAINAYQKKPEGAWTYVMGVDLGFVDSDAVAVLGWTDNDPAVYLVDEVVQSKLTVSECGKMVKELWERWRPVATEVDAGGLGKKILEELQRRWLIPCEAAEKSRKLEHIELLNDALRTAKFKARSTTRFAEECMRVQWSAGDMARGIRKVSDGFHSDITDAVLYAYRRCRHYLYRAPEARVIDLDTVRQARIDRLAIDKRRQWHDEDMKTMGFQEDDTE